MILYCRSCNQLHSFTPSQIERIIYELQAAEATASANEAVSVMDANEYCLCDSLSNSSDMECYLEHVEQAVLTRKQLQKEASK